ncbi:putative major facilitator superfamily, MFS transporter superfamily [Helianthus annuus]|nr:putative major facilitator superfamily, MFS transporter superfamily [Helianthus annuus]KAJ0484546.1 putative major facilitator superfamily, MFS transporter superfamily [Helianthus annuus]KAJ0655101.1 putative major facilitator superfamily, MFS transporter superfamily [Helianthus annuus]KAJ0658809.1 putative major facilitator superfamily, MFS transporter superfamily [Helianthus annuus]KAJ0839033.1 putative major facilitator superfamily, MFS transporter superfamily [Helianthus annuus]
MKQISSFSLHLIKGRWSMFFASVLIMSLSGAGYIFALYSGEIKTTLGYDQSTLNLVSTFKDLGGTVGIMSGLINEISPPWVVLLLGAAMSFSGYFMIWLPVTGKIAKPPVWQMCLFIFIGANSQTFANTGALVTCVTNFPQGRGAVLGLLKGFVGLSGAIISQLYHAFYGHDPKSLILFIGWLPAVVSLVFLPIIRVLKPVRHRNDLKILYNFLYVSLGLAGFLMAIIIAQHSFQFSKAEYAATAAVVVTLLLAPMAIVIREELKLWKANQDQMVDRLPTKSIAEDICSKTPLEKEVSCWRTAFTPPERGEDFTILQALFSMDMLLLFAATAFGVGGVLTAIDNLAQIGQSLGYKKATISTFVSLVSIWNYLGRVGAGFVSEVLYVKYKFPRPLMLTIVLCIACVGHLLIAFGASSGLYFSSVVMGFCNGAQWPLIFAIISEICGLKYYSTLLNWGAAAIPVGTYVLNVVVAGRLYDKEAERQMREKGMVRKAGQDLICMGVECYRTSFFIITGATVFACLLSIILVVRTTDLYRGDIYRKFRDEEEVERKTGEDNSKAIRYGGRPRCVAVRRRSQHRAAPPS